jgi:hypothetical protein
MVFPTQAGVIEPFDFAIFQDHGYMGLYGGETVNLGIKLLEFHQLSWRGRFSSSGFSSQFLGIA